jgi:hypothetical protein
VHGSGRQLSLSGEVSANTDWSHVQIEVGFKLSSNTWLQPDVGVVRAAQIERADPDGYYEGAPAIAIEVASEANTGAQLDLKMELYFAHGAEEVWVVYIKRNESAHTIPMAVARHLQRASCGRIRSRPGPCPPTPCSLKDSPSELLRTRPFRQI